ncbi:MAG: hypothetical protein V3W34_16950 [Phycisphaerae bacterium]
MRSDPRYTIDANGDILVLDKTASSTQGAVFRLVLGTCQWEVASVDQLFEEPWNMSFDVNGDLLVADLEALPVGVEASGGIIQVDLFGDSLTNQSEVYSGAPFIDPADISIDVNGDFLILDVGLSSETGGIFRVDRITNERSIVFEGSPLVDPMAIANASTVSSQDCNTNSVPDECEVPPLCPTCPDCNNNGIPDGCETGCVGPTVTVTSGIASRYIRITPGTNVLAPTAIRVTNKCTSEVGWVRLNNVDYDDGPQGLVNVGIAVADCDDVEFRSPCDWLGAGDMLVVTGDIIAPNTEFDVAVVCGSCADQTVAAMDTTANRTWKYSDASGDGQVTFFADLFKMFTNTAANGFPFWTGPDPGYEVDTQGNNLPDQQTTFFADISSAFDATSAGGCTGFWAGATCCTAAGDCHPCETGCDGGACSPPPPPAK